ncbi:phosphatidylglycerol lysyltransferase domain-containing protein [Yoonia sp. BS5-3]|uniref:Phosphatidylglycerol lysyltransferase domain-containing protein n=1 Tax=Yoonia phaeophyticola TaxID=3137369 RepID=A0ABZ2V5Q1_9RHOB
MITPATTRPQAQTILRIGLPLLILLICGGLLWQRVTAMDIGAIGQAIGQVTPLQWALAGVATWGSFHAIGRYDALWHRVLQTGIASFPARRAGIQAIAIAQTLGFGAITGSLVRWRALPSLSLWQTAHLTLAVTVTFTSCWAAYAIGAIWWLGIDPDKAGISPFMILIIFMVFGSIVAISYQKFTPALSGRDIGTLAGLTAVDMACAALALYILLPAGTGLPFSTVAAAYVIALGIGLISNTPCGAGSFDLTVLALVPLDAPEPLVAALLAFRIVYYLAPALIALIGLARPGAAPNDPADGPASWGLARQSGALQGGWHLGWLPGLTLSFGAHPSVQAKSRKINALNTDAHFHGRIAVLYNCDRRMAKAARDLGWHVRRTAMEAMIRPQTWSTAGGKRQTLRRKLRNAAQAGVTITKAGADLPIKEMDQIARAWAISHGGELGFSMGRYTPAYVQDQHVFLIKNDAQLIGFVTFHGSKDDWVLDLIRHVHNTPDGAIQCAITAAIGSAKAAGVTHLSLACAPDPRYTPAFWSKRRAGLIQFKRSFGPIWVPRYHAAPNRATFWLSGMIIGIAIYRPLANMPFRLGRMLRKMRNSAVRGRFPIELGRHS